MDYKRRNTTTATGHPTLPGLQGTPRRKRSMTESSRPSSIDDINYQVSPEDPKQGLSSILVVCQEIQATTCCPRPTASTGQKRTQLPTVLFCARRPALSPSLHACHPLPALCKHSPHAPEPQSKPTPASSNHLRRGQGYSTVDIPQ